VVVSRLWHANERHALAILAQARLRLAPACCYATSVAHVASVLNCGSVPERFDGGNGAEQIVDLLLGGVERNAPDCGAA
jgi:hypothetical protein